MCVSEKEILKDYVDKH